MAYRKVEMRIWGDAKFSALSEGAKLLFLYLLTSPQSTSMGLVAENDYTVSKRLGIPFPKGFQELFSELSEKALVEYSEDGGFFWIRNFLKHNAPNDNQVKGWSEVVNQFPECPLLFDALDSIRSYCFSREQELGELFDESVGNRFGNRYHNGSPKGSHNGSLKGSGTVSDIESNIESNIESESEARTRAHARTHASPPPAADDFDLTSPDPEEPNNGDGKEDVEAATKKAPRNKPLLFSETGITALPAEWRKYCEDYAQGLIDADKLFTEFSFYWTQGDGKDTRRSLKGWATTWQRRVRDQADYMSKHPARARSVSAQTPATGASFVDVDFSEGVNCDGTF